MAASSFPMMRSLTVLCAVTSFAAPSEANTFLAYDHSHDATWMQGPPLLQELEQVLGVDVRASVQKRVTRLEEAMRPMFQSLPKSADGGLGADGVRYALHRVFVDRHGWFVEGLGAAGEAWNSSSPACVFKEHHDGVHSLFERRLGNHSFNLHQIAVMAATLESFVHAETVERLHAVYRLEGLSRVENAASEEQVSGAIDTYMMMYVLGTNHSSATPAVVQFQKDHVNEYYPTWESTRDWARNVREEVIRAAVDSSRSATSFDTTTRAVEAIGDSYGRWQDKECRDLKTSLLKMEEAGTGRVRLSTFYQSALDGNWQFSESLAYLRQLGAIDESDAKGASVIIPNYVNSPSNCVASSKFYSVCCMDECEGLMSHLETHVAAPDASPERIAELVAELPSATVAGPRTLPAPLVQRLSEIASQYNGMVPLHGRLFAQWMHHAYPRECTYPHVSGTTMPMRSERWAKETGEEAVADEDTMRSYVKVAKRGALAAARMEMSEDDEGLPWSPEDELFVSRASQPESVRKPNLFKGFALFAVAFSMVFMLVRTFTNSANPFESPSKQLPKQRYSV